MKKAAEDAANLTPEAVYEKMSPAERHRLSKVRNIGIAVRRDAWSLQAWTAVGEVLNSS